MKLCCFSYNSLPQNDAEAFCTARFLSALATKGLEVELITVDHQAQVEKSVQDELLHPGIKIHRIPLEPASPLSLTDAWTYKYFSNHPIQIGPLVQRVRKHLAAYADKPILLTRASPAISNVVGFHTKDLASLWVAHFSDPSPGVGAYSGRTRHIEMLESWWSKRILISADIISVTNRHAVRWFRERHSPPDSTSFHVAYHVGTPSLQPADRSGYYFDASQVNFAHVGFWGKRRFMADVIREFEAANQDNPRIALRQFGPVDPGATDELAGIQWLTVNPESINPRVSTAILERASINVVIDQYDHLSYCPYLPSKFAYAVAARRPILAIGQENSEMGKLFEEYGSFYFANIERPGALRETLLKISKTPHEQLLRPCNRLAAIFDPNNVATKFSDALLNKLPARNSDHD